ncbi:FPC/CPF motif-containing protein YcgG [Agrobacterium vitis]|nr:FPC/CPF motif-containing protein YcgG [Agrobacterium vitis]MBE1438381.1 FPC/CPF motif-containing protein YcgG [Agrobacterium vitis]
MLLNQDAAFSISMDDPNFPWINEILRQFESRFRGIDDESRKFPCVFAQNAFSKSNINFLPIPFDQNISHHRYDLLRDGLARYLNNAKTWDGDVNTAEPLLVIFEPVDQIKTTCDYQSVFTDCLQYLIDHDNHEWIGGIPQDPGTDYWTMCFDGTQIFINVSHPNNQKRLSRNLCDALVLVINPRERFDRVAGTTKKGHLIREQIRKNIDAYDLIPRSPYLGHYQNGDLEWPQYMLPDDNESMPMACPLKFHRPKGQ